jgi:CheY-like chemotaxis protein
MRKGRKWFRGRRRPFHKGGGHPHEQHKREAPRMVYTGLPVDEEPLEPPPGEGAPGAETGPDNQIIAAVDDLFFSVKITDTARKVGAKVRFVKSDKELLEAASEQPSLIIVDLNAAAMKPLPTITKIKGDKALKRISVIGYLSHVQGDLKQKAHEIGCDMVLARSAFSQNLPVLLKRHGGR